MNYTTSKINPKVNSLMVGGEGEGLGLGPSTMFLITCDV